MRHTYFPVTSKLPCYFCILLPYLQFSANDPTLRLDLRERENKRGKENLMGKNEHCLPGIFSIPPVYLASPFPMRLAFYLDYKPVGWSSVARPLCVPDKDPQALFQDSDYYLPS